MVKHTASQYPNILKHVVVGSFVLVGAVALGIGTNYILSEKFNIVWAQSSERPAIPVPVLDTARYDMLMERLANNPAIMVATTTPVISTSTVMVGTTTITTVTTTQVASSTLIVPPSLWPVHTVYPNVGALLPFNRILAYYGNLYSKQMGALGQYPAPEMLARLQEETKRWQEADPLTPTIPALHYIVVTAQGSAGDDGMYRLRMPSSEIDKIIAMAESIHGIVFLDFQVGLSSLQAELPVYEQYFKLPNVHLGIDPEFSMKTGAKPGTVIGTFDATDVNYAANYLAQIVRDNNIPPKVLVVHRFTQPMLTNYQNITPLPEVQIVVNMDGWGAPQEKFTTYNAFIRTQPIQFTGFKLFYGNDVKRPPQRMLTPTEVLDLKPIPSYIQYQ